MTDVQLRFLRAIVERLPLDRIAEAHVFPPMRQGVMESGIAVIAAVREVAAEPAIATPAIEEPAIATPAIEEPAMVAPADDGAAVPDAEACDPTEDASRDAEDAPGDAAPGAVADAPSPAPARRDAPHRHTVYTARYRLALKGPERGRWELNVVEEADAPLLTVEMVVRGVQRRTGEGADPERLDVAALRELLEAPAA